MAMWHQQYHRNGNGGNGINVGEMAKYQWHGESG
jgi:hypothetical protein